MNLQKVLLLIVFFVIKTTLLQAQSDQIVLVDHKEGCSPLKSTFSIVPDNVVKVKWDFGNGSTSVLNNPTVLYQEAGEYNVTLFLEYDDQTKDTVLLEKYIRVIDQSIANFELDNSAGCNQVEVSFLNTSENANTFLWDFGDGSSSTESNPGHTYTKAGEYTVSLVAYNEFGCGTAHVKEELIAIDPLVFNVDKSIVCQNETVTFEADKNYTSYLWNFGDGKQSELASPMHSYAEAGAYDITLTVTDEKGCQLTVTNKQLINVTETPEPNITLSDSVICLDGEVEFTAQIDENESIIWKLNEDIVSTESKFKKSFDKEGSFDLEVTYKSSSGCVNVISYPKAITVVKAAAPIFEVSEFEGCAPFEFSIKNMTRDVKSTTWYIDDKKLIGNELNYTLEKKGEYAVEAKIAYSNGCVSDHQFDQQVLVHDTKNKIKASVLKGCMPLSTQFSLDDKNVGSVKWNFGNGDEAEEITSSTVYSQPGQYNVSVFYQDEFGCDKDLVLEKPVEVLDTTITYDTPPIITTCAYSDVYFYGGMGHDYWQWEFGDGSTSTEKNPVHVYDKEGNYKVSLRTNTKDGCPTTIPLYNEIDYTSLEATLDYSVIQEKECEEYTVQLNIDTSPSHSVVWKFEDGSTSTKKKPIRTFYNGFKKRVTAMITDKNGCSVNKALIIESNWTDCELLEETEEDDKKKEKKDDDENLIVNSCSAPFEISFDNPNEQALQLLWHFGDGNTSTEFNPVHTYTTPGTYMVAYTATLEHEKTIKVEEYMQVNIYDPEVDYHYDFNSTCTGIEASFQPVTQQLHNWQWHFSDGTQSQNLEVNKTYTHDQIDQVTFTATDENGCKVSSIKNVVIGNPHAKFDYDDNLCLGEDLIIQHNLQGFNNYRWIFDDGEFSTDIEPQHTYASSGIYRIRLEATDPTGCVKTIQLPEPVSVVNPTANLEIKGSVYGCNEHKVKFINKSKEANQWQWDFGNGQTSKAKNPTVTFSPGVYSVTLTAGNNTCKDTKVWEDLIKVDVLTADFNLQQESNCLPSKVTFHDKSINALSWAWDFGDGQKSNLQNPAHTFQKFPGKKVKLTVSNGKGCKVSKSAALQFFQPSISVDNAKGCIPLAVNFTSKTKNVKSWSWDFGDGHTSTDENPRHTYNKSGNYHVSLKAVSNSGCVSTIEKKNFIKVGAIQANYSSQRDESICAPLLVNFNNESTGATAFHWDFGDGAFSQLPDPLHIFSKVGKFSPKLVVTNDLGCKDSVILENHVVTQGPQTKFSISDSTFCAPAEVRFTDQSVSAKSWQWIFGDGSTSDTANPSHEFISPGIYSVSLTAKDEIGCSQTVSYDSITVYPQPEAKFDLNISNYCLPVPIQLDNQSTNLKEASFYWDFGNQDFSNDFEPTYQYNKPGKFLVTLKVTNGATCTDQLTFPGEVVVRDTFNLKQPEVFQLSVKDDTGIEIISKPYEKNNLKYHVLFRKSDLDSNFQSLDTLKNTTNEYYIDYDVLTQLHTYQYKIQSHVYCQTAADLQQLNNYQSIKLSLRNVNNIVSLQWNKYQGHDFAYYSIERKKEAENWQEVARVKPNVLQYVDNKELCPGKYQYRVVARLLNGLTFNSQSNTSTTFITTDYTKQKVNVVRTTVIDQNNVLTEWKSPEFGKSNIRWYQIWRSENKEAFVLMDSVQAGMTSYVDQQVLTDKNEYTYKIQVVNSCLIESVRSNTGNSILLKKKTKNYLNKLYWNPYNGWKEGVKHYLLQKQNEDGQWETVEILDKNQLEKDVNLE